MIQGKVLSTEVTPLSHSAPQPILSIFSRSPQLFILSSLTLSFRAIAPGPNSTSISGLMTAWAPQGPWGNMIKPDSRSRTTATSSTYGGAGQSQGHAITNLEQGQSTAVTCLPLTYRKAPHHDPLSTVIALPSRDNGRGKVVGPPSSE
jgi:hypothetical protein